MPSELRNLVPIYLLVGPFFAIIEVAPLSILMISNCDNRITRRSSVHEIGKRCIVSVRSFLCYPKGLSHILIALIVLISIFLSNHDPSISPLTTIVKDKTDLQGCKTSFPPFIHHRCLLNNPFSKDLEYSPSKRRFNYTTNASTRRMVSNNLIDKYRRKYIGNNAVTKGVGNNNKTGYSFANETKNNLPNRLWAISKLTKKRSSIQVNTESSMPKMNKPTSSSRMSRLKKRGNNLIQTKDMNILNKLYPSTVNNNITTRSQLKPIKSASQLNLSNIPENTTWHHVLPIWKKVMHNLAATALKASRNEENTISTKDVITTWKNTLLGMLAITLFLSFVFQLSLLVTVLTTFKVAINDQSAFLIPMQIQCSCINNH